MPKIKKMKKAFCLFAVLFLFILSCQNAENVTTDYDITCYTATYGEGIYKSDNGGKSWYPMKMDQDDIHLYFKRLFLNTQRDTLYIATTGAGLFTVDLNKGVFQGIDQYKGQNIRTVAFTGKMENEKLDVLVGMFEEGISRVDGEENNRLNEGLTYRDVNSIITSSNIILAGTIKDVFKWDNKNNTWISSSQGIKNKNIISMSATPKGDVLYAGAGGYDGVRGRFEDVPCIYISKDKGETWAASDDGIPDGTFVYTIAVNISKPNRIYIGTSDGIYMSDDSGNDWSKTDNGLPDEYRVFDVRIKHMTDGNDVVYAAGSKGIYMTVDGDDPVWISKNYGLPKTNITGIAIK